MTDHIALEQFTRELFECLDETFYQTHGVYLDKNTSLFQTLAGVSAAEASQRAGSQCATIAAQVEHVRFYLDVLNETISAQKTLDVNWREIWETIGEVTPDHWKAQKQRLKDSYDRVLDTLRNYEHWDGEYGVAGSMAVLVHTAYHLGGIRQSLCAIKSKKENN